MIRRILLMGVLLCVPRPAQGDGELESHGVTYRVSQVATTFMLSPVRGRWPDTLQTGTQIRWCDDLVRAVLEGIFDRSAGAPMARDRVIEIPPGGRWVEYRQHHQSYPVISGGARVVIDAGGQVRQCGGSWEPERLRAFHPRPARDLRRIARRVVPHWSFGPPFEERFWIDGNGDRPAQLVYAVVFRVTRRGMEEGWQVLEDAETGRILMSASTTQHLDDATRAGNGSFGTP